MKTRFGFISNSSSTSFIIRPDEKQRAEEQGLVLIGVGELRKALKKYEDSRTEAIEAIRKLGADHWAQSQQYIDIQLEDLESLKDEDFITEPYDRDMAYQFGIDLNYGAFQEDL